MKLNRSGFNSMWVIGLLVISLIVLVVLTFNKEADRSDTVNLDELFSKDKVDHVIEIPMIEPEDAALFNVQETEEAATEPAVDQKPQALTQPVTTAQNIPLSTPPPADQAPYAIQIGSFKEKALAENLMKSVNVSGQPVYIESRDLGEKGVWHRVRIGSFQTQQDAKNVLTSIQPQYKEAFVTKR